ncbi:MAG: outer membrane beta-barrel protein [Bacteroidetes bacterium]|nr:outer membrane beta-barrel protein [Bacteroidota bacterium]
MKIRNILLAVMLILSCSSFAQTKFALGIAGGVNFGLSDFADKYGNGYNGTVTLLYSAVVSTDLTFSIGYNKWNKEERSFISIPLMAGFRFYFPALGLKFYLPGYLGLHITTSEAELPTAVINGEIIGGNVVSFSNNHFGFGIGAGVLVPFSPMISLDINTTFNSISKSESNSNYISINGGILFGL